MHKSLPRYGCSRLFRVVTAPEIWEKFVNSKNTVNFTLIGVRQPFSSLTLITVRVIAYFCDFELVTFSATAPGHGTEVPPPGGRTVGYEETCASPEETLSSTATFR